MSTQTSGGAPRRVALWFGILAGPVAWVIEELLGYYLASLECHRGGFGGFTIGRLHGFLILIDALSFLMVALALAGLVVSWQIWRGAQAAKRETVAGRGDRLPFMALGGVALDLLFLLVIVASGVPPLILGCAV